MKPYNEVVFFNIDLVSRMRYLIISMFIYFSIFHFACSNKHYKLPSQYEVQKSEQEWRRTLSSIEFYVLREAGTERAFSGDLWDHKEDGIYTCRGCGAALFDSKTKYKSGTGWPSYYQPISDAAVGENTDYLLGYARTEVHCAGCGGHLGHVFPDGPKPTGLRYCMNSASMDFVVRDSVVVYDR